MTLAPDHPIRTLLFYVEDEVSDEVCEDIEATIARVAASRSWVIAPPAFVNEHSEDDDDDDEPLLTLGGFLRIYSGLPPHELPLEIDRALYEDVFHFILWSGNWRSSIVRNFSSNWTAN